LSILKIWWCFEVWIWYMELEWIVWLYDVVGYFVDYDCIVNECDFEWVIKLGTWCIACLQAQLGYLRAYEHNLVTCVLTSSAYEHNSVTCVPTSTLPVSTIQLLASLWAQCLRAQLSYLHIHTYIVMWWNVLHALYIVVLLNVLLHDLNALSLRVCRWLHCLELEIPASM